MESTFIFNYEGNVLFLQKGNVFLKITFIFNPNFLPDVTQKLECNHMEQDSVPSM